MKYIKKHKKIMIFLVIFAILIYPLYGFINYQIIINSDLGKTVNTLVKEIYSSYGDYDSSNFKDLISEDDYHNLCYRYKDEKIKNENNLCVLYKLDIKDNKAMAKFKFFYNAYDNDKNIITSSGVWFDPMDLVIEFQYINNNWKVSNAYQVIASDCQ